MDVEKETFTDKRDGKVYKTVKIGNQTWMAENLAYAAEGSVCYDNDPANAEKYGRLYNWETSTKACPEGWHLPSKEEWETLVNFTGGVLAAGEKLKASSGWNENGYGTDEHGFDALPGGRGFSDGAFTNDGKLGIWWSNSDGGFGRAYHRSIFHRHKRIYWDYGDKHGLFSVRCVKD